MAGKPPDDIDRRVAENIRAKRVERNMTIGEVAAKLEISGAQYQKHEKGINRISIGRFFQIANVLGVNPMSLV